MRAGESGHARRSLRSGSFLSGSCSVPSPGPIGSRADGALGQSATIASTPCPSSSSDPCDTTLVTARAEDLSERSRRQGGVRHRDLTPASSAVHEGVAASSTLAPGGVRTVSEIPFTSSMTPAAETRADSDRASRRTNIRGYLAPS